METPTQLLFGHSNIGMGLDAIVAVVDGDDAKTRSNHEAKWVNGIRLMDLDVGLSADVLAPSWRRTSRNRF